MSTCKAGRNKRSGHFYVQGLKLKGISTKTRLTKASTGVYIGIGVSKRQPKKLQPARRALCSDAIGHKFLEKSKIVMKNSLLSLLLGLLLIKAVADGGGMV